MDKTDKYTVADISLAENGSLRVDWARARMPVLAALKEEALKTKPLAGMKVAGCLHVTKETAVLIETIAAAGAEISWSRPILENGLIIGIFFIIWRLWITKDLLLSCIRAVKRGNYLAIFIFGAAGPILLFGLLGQPTNLGFAAFGSGLCLAAAISEKKPS